MLRETSLLSASRRPSPPTTPTASTIARRSSSNPLLSSSSAKRAKACLPRPPSPCSPSPCRASAARTTSSAESAQTRAKASTSSDGAPARPLPPATPLPVSSSREEPQSPCASSSFNRESCHSFCAVRHVGPARGQTKRKTHLNAVVGNRDVDAEAVCCEGGSKPEEEQPADV